MTQYLIKILVSALIVVAVSELAKRSSLWGGLLASLPIVSFLAMIWLYMDTKDVDKVAKLSINIFWLVLPSLMFFLLFPFLLRIKVHFAASFLMATATILFWHGIVIFAAKNLRLLA